MLLDQATGFTDLIKNGVLANFTSGSMSIWQLLLAMAVSFGMGLFIFFIYKRTFNGVLYSKTYNQSLIMLCMVTTLIIRCVTANLALSLGMVGALSIVRFRTAVKDVIDTVYMFWAIAVGITLGAGTGFYLYAIAGSGLIGLVMYLLYIFGGKGSYAYLLIIRHAFDATNEVAYAVNRLPKPARMKSKAVTPNGVELTIELRLSGDNNYIVNDLMAIDGVFDATLISYQGDYAA
jgi:ABC-type Fe3+ transport system permease subunit